MAIEIDQSGRVEDLSTGTAVAFANDESGAVFITAGAKRKLIVYLRKYSIIPAKDLPVILFTVFVFLVLKGRKSSVFVIDEEYSGKNQLIVETLTKLFVQRGMRLPLDIRFARIGKHSSAHVVAWKTHRTKGNMKAVIKVQLEDVLKIITKTGK